MNHHVRTRLDEIKRTELERLRLAAMKHVIFLLKLFITVFLFCQPVIVADY